ncbi:MAG: OmpA family protein [Marinilabiliaceae bacterium]|nr:OmpA family protein [Marinilabiliaceae bacterium]
MKKHSIKVLILIIFLGTFFFLTAQEKKEIFTSPINYWFLSVGQGINIYYGEHDKFSDFSDRLAPALDLSFGKMLGHKIGLRAQYNGLTCKGILAKEGDFTDNTSFDGRYYREHFNLIHLHGDILLNSSNLLFGNNPERKFQMIPFLGVGYAMATGNGNTNGSPTISAGLINKVRLLPALDLNIELRGILVNEEFDGISEGRGGEGIASATIGFTYKFNQKGPTRLITEEKEGDAFVQTEAVITESGGGGGANWDERQKLLKELNEKERAIEQLQARVNELLKKQKEQPQRTEADTVDLAIFFDIGETNLKSKDLINLKYIAEKIKQAKQKYRVIGFADSATGSSRRNKYLSEQRAQNVYNALINEFKVPKEKLIYDGKGSKLNPFNDNENNRVVLVMPEE